jgi:hypothetical protein
MPEAVQQNAVVQEQAQPQAPQQTGWQIFQSLVGRMVMMYFVMQAMTYFRGGGPMNGNKSAPPGTVSQSAEMPGNIFSKGTRFVREVSS